MCDVCKDDAHFYYWMKIVLTGGGTGGHFYPIIAIAEEINQIAKEEKLLEAKLYYISTDPYDRRMLFDNNIIFVQGRAGKMRRYFSIANFFDYFKTAFGIFFAIIDLFNIFPDVVFGKGGYASFPTLLAARILRIPVIIHESDSAPGRVNAWAGKFAQKIAVSYPEAANFFPAEKVAYTGNPIRREIMRPETKGNLEFFKFETGIPTIFIIGGSLGARAINDVILEALPDLVAKYQIIHQTGEANFDEVSKTSALVLADSPYKDRYRPLAYMNNLAINMASGLANLVISRAGSTIFEIAAWGLPSIIIPIPESISHDQHKNAFSYARTGSAIVIEEVNLSSHVLVSEIDRLFSKPELMDSMKKSALAFARLDAANKIAKEIINIALKHEK